MDAPDRLAPQYGGDVAVGRLWGTVAKMVVGGAVLVLVGVGAYT